MSHWEGSKGKVSAPGIRVAGHPGVPMVLSSPHSCTTSPRAEITLVGLRRAFLTHGNVCGEKRHIPARG